MDIQSLPTEIGSYLKSEPLGLGLGFLRSVPCIGNDSRCEPDLVY